MKYKEVAQLTIVNETKCHELQQENTAMRIQSSLDSQEWKGKNKRQRKGWIKIYKILEDLLSWSKLWTVIVLYNKI